MTCTHCTDAIDARTARECWTCKYTSDHVGLCCDCFDLKLGMPLNQLNDERAAKGKAPVKAWEKKT